MKLADPYRTMATREAMLIRLDAKPDLAAASAMARGADRKAAVWTALEQTAAASQAPFLAIADALQGAGLVTQVQSLTSPNLLVVTPKFGKAGEVFRRFQVDGVDSIWSNLDGGLMWSPSTGEIERPPPGGDEPCTPSFSKLTRPQESVSTCY